MTYCDVIVSLASPLWGPGRCARPASHQPLQESDRDLECILCQTNDLSIFFRQAKRACKVGDGDGQACSAGTPERRFDFRSLATYNDPGGQDKVSF
jgi:hypothetical protein